MTGSKQRPLLFVDVDGPLIPFGAAPGEYPAYQARSSRHAEENPLVARINPEHGKRLSALDCELIWATSWMDDVNDCIAPRLGLPQLAIVAWPDAPATEEPDVRDSSGRPGPSSPRPEGRPFVWLDDEITNSDRVWVSANYPGPALLHRVNPNSGLTHDYSAVEEWLRTIHTAPPLGVP
ncbi:hypothetical protein [Spirillospora sp. NPDC048819]|uniref:hypothetical protein n=1 Tax=Spirillospora sp. NPDC048819 TaxID=3155268 RepID=UPI0033C2466E